MRINKKYETWEEALDYLLTFEQEQPFVLDFENDWKQLDRFVFGVNRYNFMFQEDKAIRISYDQTMKEPPILKVIIRRHEIMRYRSPSSDLVKRISAIPKGETLFIPNNEQTTDSVRVAVSRNMSGFSVRKCQGGCIVYHTGDLKSLSQQVATALREMEQPGEFRDIACEPDKLGSLRAYVSMHKTVGTTFITRPVENGKIRIMRVE